MAGNVDCSVYLSLRRFLPVSVFMFDVHLNHKSSFLSFFLFFLFFNQLLSLQYGENILNKSQSYLTSLKPLYQAVMMIRVAPLTLKEEKLVASLVPG